MPRIAMDYSTTIIYKIVCNDLDIKYTYVGHTTNFTKRKCLHKYNCVNANSKSHNYKVYKTIRENGGWDDWKMVEVEKYPCNDLNEATKRERYWYEELNADLNMLKPNLTEEEQGEYKKEYYDNNKQRISEVKKIYNKKNADKIKEDVRKYNEENKDSIKLVNKTYAEIHKEEIQEYLKNYRAINNEKLKEQKRQYRKDNLEKVLLQEAESRKRKKQLQLTTQAELKLES